MTVSKPETVEVTQADRDLHKEIFGFSEDGSVHTDRRLRAFARHRLNATPSRQDGLREALEKIARAYNDWRPDGMFASTALFHAAAVAKSALSDTPPPEALRGFLEYLRFGSTAYYGHNNVEFGEAYNEIADALESGSWKDDPSAFNNGGK